MSTLYEKVEKYLQKLEKESNRKNLRDLPHPFQMKNLEKGVRLFLDSINQGKKVLIVGDYDADGIMATTIMIDAFKAIGLSDLVDYYIPHRLKDGYGLSPDIIDYYANDFQVILTVDNGISAIEAVKKAKKYNMTVIITDHHIPPKILPEADIIINPKQEGETFPFIHISGATVAWYFIAGLKALLNLKDLNMKKFIDLVAITIISDVMPLKDINIPLLKEGMKKIKNMERYLYKMIWNDWTAPVIDETSIAFQLVPLINAIGRINNAKKGVELFLSKNKSTIEKRLQEIKRINEARKDLSEEGLKNAIKQIKKIEKKYGKKIEEIGVVFIRDPNFHEGIVGIIAGKIAEKYNIPTFVFGWNEEKKVWKGSGRSGRSGIHLYDFTNSFHEFLETFGGHKGAVGLTISDENFEKAFEKAMEIIRRFPKEKIQEENVFNCETLEDINEELLELIENYKPYGEERPLPEFITKAKLVPPFKILKEKHLKCFLENKKRIETLFFNLTEEEKKIINDAVKHKKELDIKFYLSKNFNLYENSFNFNLIAQILRN